ncbi:uncharacterized protein LOC118407726 [Branchiostoma floridae]|uniref:Uncharacterized protein LOC118407726 n=1 Tax=Branchiostoma floridae TaxID=7739 RepID=A0A9J7HVG5_BRAFL|nr:uncharacterized protein LOC118407726 [Branchiostoma floridae]
MAATVRQWTSHDVQAWLLSLNIPCDAPLLQAADGKFLCQLHSLRAEAPEFFHQCLRRDLGFEDLRDLLNFADALKSLPTQDSVLHSPSDETRDTAQKTSPEIEKPTQPIKEGRKTTPMAEENPAFEQKAAVTIATEEAGSAEASMQDVPGAKEDSTSPERGVSASLTAQDEGARAESPALAAALQGLPPVATGASAAPVPVVSSAEFAALLKRELAVALERTSQGSPSPPPTGQQSSCGKDESKDETDTKRKD